MMLITKRITGRCILETDSCGDITGIDFFDVCTVVRMHLHQSAESFFCVFCRIEDIRACSRYTGVDSEVGENSSGGTLASTA